MITFAKYTDIVNDIAKKLKTSKDAAVSALVKAQEKGIDPLKWQKHLTMLKQFIQIVADYDPSIDEREMTDKQKLVQIQHYWDGLDHMASDERKKKSLNITKGYTNIKLNSRGKIISFDEAKKKKVKLPPHLAKFFDKAGNLKDKKKAAKIGKDRAMRGVTITDVTPDWMFEKDQDYGRKEHREEKH